MTFSKNSSSLNDFMDRVSNEFTESRSIFGIDVIVFVAVIIVGFILLGVVLKRRVRKTVRFSAAIVLIILVLVTINKVSLPDELGENQTTPVLQEPENIPEERNENDIIKTLNEALDDLTKDYVTQVRQFKYFYSAGCLENPTFGDPKTLALCS